MIKYYRMYAYELPRWDTGMRQTFVTSVAFDDYETARFAIGPRTACGLIAVIKVTPK